MIPHPQTNPNKMQKAPRNSFAQKKKSKEDRIKKLHEFTDEIQLIRKSYAKRIAAAAREMQKAAAMEEMARAMAESAEAEIVDQE
jgi:hypothetical protein